MFNLCFSRTYLQPEGWILNLWNIGAFYQLAFLKVETSYKLFRLLWYHKQVFHCFLFGSQVLFFWTPAWTITCKPVDPQLPRQQAGFRVVRLMVDQAALLPEDIKDSLQVCCPPPNTTAQHKTSLVPSLRTCLQTHAERYNATSKRTSCEFSMLSSVSRQVS